MREHGDDNVDEALRIVTATDGRDTERCILTYVMKYCLRRVVYKDINADLVILDCTCAWIRIRTCMGASLHR